jgi:hypothetical protein
MCNGDCFFKFCALINEGLSFDNKYGMIFESWYFVAAAK